LSLGNMYLRYSRHGPLSFQVFRILMMNRLAVADFEKTFSDTLRQNPFPLNFLLLAGRFSPRLGPCHIQLRNLLRPLSSFFLVSHPSAGEEHLSDFRPSKSPWPWCPGMDLFSKDFFPFLVFFYFFFMETPGDRQRSPGRVFLFPIRFDPIGYSLWVTFLTRITLLLQNDAHPPSNDLGLASFFLSNT